MPEVAWCQPWPQTPHLTPALDTRCCLQLLAAARPHHGRLGQPRQFCVCVCGVSLRDQVEEREETWQRKGVQVLGIPEGPYSLQGLEFHHVAPQLTFV